MNGGSARGGAIGFKINCLLNVRHKTNYDVSLSRIIDKLCIVVVRNKVHRQQHDSIALLRAIHALKYANSARQV